MFLGILHVVKDLGSERGETKVRNYRRMAEAMAATGSTEEAYTGYDTSGRIENWKSGCMFLIPFVSYY